MTRRMLTLALIVVVIGALSAEGLGQSKLKECRVQSRPLSLQKLQRPLRLSGTVFGEATKEYLITATSNLTVDIRLTTDSQLKFDVYLLDPPTLIQKRVVDWSGTFESGKQYTLAVSNCSGKSPATFRIDMTVR